MIAADHRLPKAAADAVSDILPIAEAVLKVSAIAFMIGNLLPSAWRPTSKPRLRR